MAQHSFGASPLPSTWERQQAAAAAFYQQHQQHDEHHQHQQGAAAGGGASEGFACGNRRSFPRGIDVDMIDTGFGLDMDLDLDLDMDVGVDGGVTGIWLDRHPGIAISERWML